VNKRKKREILQICRRESDFAYLTAEEIGRE